MPFDAFVLNAVSDEITDRLIKTGERVSKIFQINQELIISFRSENSSDSLFFSVHPQSCRIHFTERHYSHPLTPPAFCMLLRKHLLGGLLISLEQPPLERVLYLNFSAPNREGKEVIKTLVLEVMGKHSNLILLDAPAKEGGKMILGAIKPVSPNINRIRTILPHHHYSPPPLQEKLHPFALSYEVFVNEPDLSAGEPLEQALIENIQGISPFLAKETAARAGSGFLSDKTAKQVWNALQELMEIYITKNWAPTLISDQAGNPSDYSAFKPSQPITGQLRGHPSISKVLDEFYQFKEKNDAKKALTGLLNQQLSQMLKKIIKKEKAQLQELKEAKNAEQLKLCGELIILHLQKIPPRASEINLTNLYGSDNEEVKVSLDPRLNPALNAQRYFKLYRKARQAEKKMTERLEQTRQEITYLESVSFSIEKADYPALLEIKDELEEAGFLAVRGKPGPPPQKKTALFNPHRYYASLGEEIYVGKNNRQNEHLVQKFAFKTDLWLHVKDIPGAHVIIRSRNPGGETIREAALLAAYYSKASGSSNVPVDFTQVKNIKRHPAGKPGMVIYTNHKTIYVTPEEQLLRPILTRTRPPK